MTDNAFITDSHSLSKWRAFGLAFAAVSMTFFSYAASAQEQGDLKLPELPSLDEVADESESTPPTLDTLDGLPPLPSVIALPNRESELPELPTVPAPENILKSETLAEQAADGVAVDKENVFNIEDVLKTPAEAEVKQAEPEVKEEAAKPKKDVAAESQSNFSYKTQRLTPDVYKKSYSRGNKHLPIATYERDYRDLLFQTVEVGQMNNARALLDYGLSVDTRDDNGNTPLMVALMHHQITTMRMLMSRGADVRAMNNMGQTALHIASFIGDVLPVNLLLEKKADINAVDGLGLTPLMVAAGRGNEEVVSLFLDMGADITLRSEQGSTAADIADRNGHPMIAEWLGGVSIQETVQYMTPPQHELPMMPPENDPVPMMLQAPTPTVPIMAPPQPPMRAASAPSVQPQRATTSYSDYVRSYEGSRNGSAPAPSQRSVTTYGTPQPLIR